MRRWLGSVLALCCWACGGAAPAAAASQPIAGVTVGAPCRDGECAEGLSCHHQEPGAQPADRCLLEPGRCRSDWDCARGAQRCRRLGAALGVCQDSGL